jgi:hypothetical protein
MNNEETPKRGPGRPKAEYNFPTEWQKIILDAGEKGKHMTQFLIELGISWETHNQLLKRNKTYSETVDRYRTLCENYWYNQMHEHMEENGGVGYNSRLWSLIMRNKFGERWSEASKVDITSKDKEINTTQPIQIEIIKTTLNKEDNAD